MVGCKVFVRESLSSVDTFSRVEHEHLLQEIESWMQASLSEGVTKERIGQVNAPRGSAPRNF